METRVWRSDDGFRLTLVMDGSRRLEGRMVRNQTKVDLRPRIYRRADFGFVEESLRVPLNKIGHPVVNLN
jgi:hypothetical protein